MSGTAATSDSIAHKLWTARDEYVSVWERWSHREGVAHANDALDHVEAATEAAEGVDLDDTDAALLEWVADTAEELAGGERDLDDAHMLIDVIEFRLYHVLCGNGLPEEPHPTVAEVLDDIEA